MVHFGCPRTEAIRGIVSPVRSIESIAPVETPLDSLEDFINLPGTFRFGEPFDIFDKPRPPGPVDPYEYDRTLPLFGRKLASLGYEFPLPFGIGLIANYTDSRFGLSDLSINLGKGMPPPPSAGLIDFPPWADLTDVASEITSLQAKMDVWLFPFLNLFGFVGAYQGEVDLNIAIDLDQAFGLPICRPQNPCGTVLFPYTKDDVEGLSTGAGFNLVYGIAPWYGTLNGTITFNDGNADDEIVSKMLGVRIGRYWDIASRGILSVYGGATYLDIEQTITGTASLDGAFPDGDALFVSYRAGLENTDKWMAVAGMNRGLDKGWSLNAEAAFGGDSERYTFGLVYRF